MTPQEDKMVALLRKLRAAATSESYWPRLSSALCVIVAEQIVRLCINNEEVDDAIKVFERLVRENVSGMLADEGARSTKQ